MHYITRIILLSIAILAAPLPARAALVLDKIVLHAKDPEKPLKTTVGVIESRMVLHRGNVVDWGSLETAKARLIASGLFRDVTMSIDLPRDYATKLMYLTEETYAVDVHVTFLEKQSWAAAPIASFGGGDMAGGMFYGDQNLFGRGYQALFAGQVGQAKTFAALGFRDPLMAIAPIMYSISGVYRFEKFRFFDRHKMVLEVPTSVGGGEAQIGYHFSAHTRLEFGGMYNRISVQGARHAENSLAVDPQYNPRSGNLAVLQIYLFYDHTTAPEGLRRGVRIHLKNEIADAFWKSDFDYVKFNFQTELYGFFLGTYPSLIFNMVLNYPTSAKGVPLTQLLRAGGSNLRGYLVNEFRGDTLVTLQLEDQVPIFNHIPVPWTSVKFNIAAAIFADFGAVIERHPGGRIEADTAAGNNAARLRLKDFHSSFGGGLRLLLPGVAVPAVKLDIGYGIDVKDTAITLSLAGGGL